MGAKKLKRKLLTKRKKTNIPKEDLLSSGSTLLDLACSDSIAGGFAKGQFIFLVGDSRSGKTFLSLTCLAEAAHNPQFEDYRFIHDDAENGALMDFTKFFGRRTAKRIEPPNKDEDGTPLFSTTVEDFYFNLDDAFQEDEPFIYILDSMDALTATSDDQKFDKVKADSKAGRKSTGDYGTSKAKLNSVHIRRVIQGLKRTGSILIVISQTRDNIGFGSQFNPKTRGGGRALRFYSHVEVWSSIKKTLKKTVKGKQRKIGVECQLRVKKNRISGKERDVIVPIYYSYGMDDIGSCVDFLIEEKFWPKRGKKIHCPDFDLTATRDTIIEHIEDEQGQLRLKKITQRAWNEIENASKLKRKKRYE